MTAFVEATRAKATSGSSRAAARWAANRLHHRSLPRTIDGQGIENATRVLHRMAGYGNKVWPALVTWLVATGAVIGARLWRWADNNQPVDVSQAVQDGLLMPLSIARLGDAVTMFDAPWVNTLAFIVTGLPLAFLIVAIRNVLREPGDK